MALNERQSRFVNEYLVDLNATQAAIRSGYSKKTAYSIGERLLRHVEVRAAIQELQSKLQEAIRRSAPNSELRNIQNQIEKLNRKLEEYASRIKKVGGI